MSYAIDEDFSEEELYLGVSIEVAKKAMSQLGVTIAGGLINTAVGKQVTIGGGTFNVASSIDSTISGGNNNKASDIGSTVCGGESNTAGGIYSIVGGGFANIADGDYSDSTNRRAIATKDNQVTFQANGGFRIMTRTDSIDDLLQTIRDMQKDIEYLKQKLKRYAKRY